MATGRPRSDVSAAATARAQLRAGRPRPPVTRMDDAGDFEFAALTSHFVVGAGTTLALDGCRPHAGERRRHDHQLGARSRPARLLDHLLRPATDRRASSAAPAPSTPPPTAGPAASDPWRDPARLDQLRPQPGAGPRSRDAALGRADDPRVRSAIMDSAYADVYRLARAVVAARHPIRRGDLDRASSAPRLHLHPTASEPPIRCPVPVRPARGLLPAVRGIDGR